eukprot:TRINITY_DN90554_c0_g1_i1.p1 TRINITY_DN90554_c0_g1~~TRINITY_DN90554_c0_g1_i1.p1  ORF type:complete len:1248 (-),score=332.95 TRINITY_DN90554_c0_g1_i1:339-4082(-)
MGGEVHEVTLENFKSYEGLVRIGPLMKFTCIVGPNGAGKSNLMDAISFVLGVRTRHLRGDSMQDLVHRKEGEEEGAVSKRRCSVELVYVAANDSDGEPQRRIVFRRVIQPASEAGYHIDGVSVKQEHYFSSLEAIQILSKAKNFLVFQGAVEARAQSQGKDLTKFFEQVSGSESFRDEYDRLALEKAKCEDSARNMYTLKRNAQNEKKRMSQQKDEAERYTEKETERHDLQVEYFLVRLHSVEKQREELESTIEDVRRQCDEAKAATLAQEKRLEDGKQEHANMKLGLAKPDQELQDARNELDRVMPEQIKARSQFEAIQQRLEELSSNVEVDGRRRAQLHEQAKALQSQLDALEAQLPAVREQAQRESPFNSQQREQFQKAQEEAQRMTGASGQQARELELQIKSVAKQRAMEERDMRDASLRANHLKQKVEDLLEAEKSGINAQSRETHLATQRRQELEALKTSGRSHGQDRQQLEAERRKILQDIQNITATERQIEHERKLAQVSRELAQVVSGVHGRVLGLCDPVQRRYRVAVNVALGGYLDAVVTDTVQGARQCVQHLKDRMLDPVTFLPLDNLRCIPTDRRVKDALRDDQTGRLRLALDCVSLRDPRIGRAFDFMLGDVVIADTLDDGRRFVFNELKSRGTGCRVVTLQGEIISRDGNLAVSSDAARQGSTRFDFTELEQTRGKLEAIDARLCELHSKSSHGDATQAALQDEVKRLEMRARETQLGLERTQAELKVRQTELQEAELASSDAQARRLAEDESRLREELQQLELSISSVVADQFATLSAAMKVEDVQSLERDFRRAKEAALFRENEINQQINSLRAEISMVSQSIQEREARDPAVMASAARHELESLQQRHLQLEEQSKVLTSRVEDLTEALQKQQEEEKEKEQAVAHLRQQLKEQQRTAEEAKRRLAGCTSDLQAAKDTRLQLLRQSVLEDVALPISGATGQAALKKVTAAVSGTTDRTATIQIDFSGLSQERRNAASGGAAAELQEEDLRTELRRLEAELEQLRPNLKAQEHLKRADKDAQDAEEKAEKAQKHMKDCERRFEEVRIARRDKFMSCFRKVQEEIKVVYKRLTKATAGGLEGGSAFLDLEDLEDPWAGGVKFTAMPPAKRFCDISLLSGGEKTLAAMALLFATKAYQKPPFLVLDEVDAYLDHGNVQALASFISECDCQTIVISQKDRFFSRGEGLVGISKSKGSGTSVVFTVDLARMRQARAPAAANGSAPLPAPSLARCGG